MMYNLGDQIVQAGRLENFSKFGSRCQLAAGWKILGRLEKFSRAGSCLRLRPALGRLVKNGSWAGRSGDELTALENFTITVKNCQLGRASGALTH